MDTTTTPRQGPCSVCGSTRSKRSAHFDGSIFCDGSTNGHDRCRERELAQALRVAAAQLDTAERHHGSRER